MASTKFKKIHREVGRAKNLSTPLNLFWFLVRPLSVYSVLLIRLLYFYFIFPACDIFCTFYVPIRGFYFISFGFCFGRLQTLPSLTAVQLIAPIFTRLGHRLNV
jgi:hypothetical protein